MAAGAGLAKGKTLPFGHLRTWEEWTNISDQEIFPGIQGVPIVEQM